MMKIRIKFWHILILGALKYLTGFFMVLQKIAEKSLSLDIIQIMRIIFTCQQLIKPRHCNIARSCMFYQSKDLLACIRIFQTSCKMRYSLLKQGP